MISTCGFQSGAYEYAKKHGIALLQVINRNALHIMNARHFGRSTEKLETLPGQMNIFNETEVAAAEAIAEPAIEQVVVRRKKKKG